MPTVPDDFVVDEEKRHLGKISFFSKLRGYGFIEVPEEGLVPENRLFVHWKNIKSEDRFPFLTKDMEVQFGIAKQTELAPKGQVTLRAKDVTLPSGEAVNLQEALDAEQKTFIGGQTARYTGTLRFFNPRISFGYIDLKPGTELEGYGGEGAPTPTEIRVERSEVNSGTQQPLGMQDVEVEFGLWKTSRDELKAYNMTLPEGRPLTMENLENRQATNSQMYRGEVQLWNWRSGWGFIKADASVVFPPDVQEKLTKQAQEAKERAVKRGQEGSDEELLYVRRDDLAEGVRLDKGMMVMFQIYIDDKGVGATQVQAL
mmetsp:Transcript_59609/g.160629  ORF Transcript_59609/g.160629 Transcript_59609/m.160629 type:complete len:315 (+) Transcript_59609:822-1766(+)